MAEAAFQPETALIIYDKDLASLALPGTALNLQNLQKLEIESTLLGMKVIFLSGSRSYEFSANLSIWRM